MIINVTRKHIRAGIPGIGIECPVALAIKDAGWARVYVGWDRVHLNRSKPGPYSSRNLAIRQPRFVRRFTRAFDAGRKVKPFSFRLKTP